jgi:hypothetical protein
MKYRKTELGKQTFKDRNVALTPAQRSAFILFDGEKDDAVIFKSLAGMGLNADDVNFLIESGLIELTESQQPTAAERKPVESLTDFSKTASGNTEPALTDQQRYQRAYPVATRLTSGLGLRGFRLNLAVESAGSYQDLVALAPKIREAVGDEKFAEFARALRPS